MYYMQDIAIIAVRCLHHRPHHQQVRIIKQLQDLEKMFYGSSMAYDAVCGATWLPYTTHA